MSSTKKKNLPKSIKDLSKDQLTEILKKKKECNARALRIVETAIEQHVDEGWMLPNLEYINQSHYDDIVEERFIQKYCGYPFCPLMLGDIPKQQYKISLATKTVYDVTDRKKYCSAHCYKSSHYLKSQLLTSPLWYRENEVTPKFKLLKNEAENSSPKEANSKKLLELRDQGKPTVFSITEKQLRETTPIEKTESPLVLPLSKKKLEESIVIQEILDPVKNVERIVKDWFTINSFAYLFGDDELKRRFEGKEEILKSCFEEPVWKRSDPKRFDDISKLFSILKFDGDNEEREPQELKPLPDYSSLRDEAEKMNMKIRAFYTGQLEVAEVGATKETEKSDPPSELPLVDSKAQTALRRRVLLEQLNKKVPEMCTALDLGDVVKIADIRCLVHTFFLSAHNITMKPREWSLVAVIILKMLTFKIEDLCINFKLEDPRTRINILLSSYSLSDDYLENLLDWLTDAERLTQTFEEARKSRKQDMY